MRDENMYWLFDKFFLLLTAALTAVVVGGCITLASKSAREYRIVCQSVQTPWVRFLLVDGTAAVYDQDGVRYHMSLPIGDACAHEVREVSQ